MARRSDHTREELTELAIEAAVALIEKHGFAQFSARKVAAEIGYTVGTIYNVFGSYDALLLHVNARTLDHWYDFLQTRLKRGKAEPLRVLARGYVEYARTHYNRWLALFEHHRDKSTPVPDWYQDRIKRFFAMLEDTIPPCCGSQGEARRASAVGGDTRDLNSVADGAARAHRSGIDRCAGERAHRQLFGWVRGRAAATPCLTTLGDDNGHHLT